MGAHAALGAAREELATWAGGVAEAVGDGLVGVYLYGSLAHGCFHPETSDVDVVVVTEGPCSEAMISRIARAHEEAGVLIDGTFATRSQMGVDETPTPVEFVLKPMGEERVVRLPGGHGDFLLQRQDVYDCDAAIVGGPAREVVRPVPWAALARCLDYLFPHIVPRFKNPALMLSRIAYAFANQRFCSKREAGEWAMGVLGEEWRPLVAEALEKYADGVPDDQGPNERLCAFEERCARYIAGVRGAG
jgi:predicted nucleotidyltransferase